MASDILGLFTSPQQYQQNQLAQFQNRAAQEVQLSPFQQAALGARTAGYQLGQGIGGALGGQDPQLQLIARRQQLLSQLDQSDLTSFARVAKMASDAGDQELAFGIANAGREAAVKIAQANKERQVTDPFTQLVQSGKYTPASLAAYKVSQNVGDLVLFEKEGAANKPFEFEAKEARLQELKSALRVLETQPTPNKEGIQRLKDSIQAIEGVEKPEKQDIPKIGISELTGEAVYFDRNQDLQFVKRKDPKDPTKQIRVPFEGRIDQTTAKVSASSSSQQESEFSKDLGKADADRVKSAMTLRDNSISALTTLQGLSKLDEQGLISGSFATGRVGAANILATVGLISEKDQGVLANSQNYQKISGDLVLATLGGKLGSGFSNEDRKFILGLVPQLETNAQARKQLIEFMVKKNNDIVTETTRLEDYARDKKSLKGFIPKIPIFNVGGGVNKPPSQMTRQELLDAIEAKKRQPQ